MYKRNRDSKFIIYQVLYIFVITVLSLKGAGINLKEVVLKDKVVSKNVRDSLIVLIDSLYEQGSLVKSNLSPNIILENEKLKQKLTSLTNQISNTRQPSQHVPSSLQEQTVLQSPISISQTFLQNTWNIAKNNGNIPASIYDRENKTSPIVIIPTGQERQFNLGNQIEVILKFGNQEQAIRVYPMHPPEIKIVRVSTKMNASIIFVQDLQKKTVSNVIIKYQRPEQLKISYTGPIYVTGPYKNREGDIIYNVSLKLASTISEFNNWVDQYGEMKDLSGRYRTNFFFTVVDEKTNAHVVAGDVIYFTDFSR